MSRQEERYWLFEDNEYSTTIVPAAPGFVCYELDMERPRLSKPGHAVVAWVIQWRQLDNREPVGSTIPVTTQGIPENENYVVEQPDGSFVKSDGEV